MPIKRILDRWISTYMSAAVELLGSLDADSPIWSGEPSQGEESRDLL